MSTLKQKAQDILDEKEEKIVPENIKKDIQIFDVIGSLEEGIDTSDATATENDLVQGTTAYVNGDKLYGTLEDRRNDNLDIDATYVITNDEFETLYVRGSSLYNNVVVDSSTETNTVTPYNLITPEIGLTPEKIKKNEVILGVTGTYEGTSSKSKIKLFNNTSEMNSSTGNEDGDKALVYRQENGKVRDFTNTDDITYGVKFNKSYITNDISTAFNIDYEYSHMDDETGNMQDYNIRFNLVLQNYLSVTISFMDDTDYIDEEIRYNYEYLPTGEYGYVLSQSTQSFSYNKVSFDVDTGILLLKNNIVLNHPYNFSSNINYFAKLYLNEVTSTFEGVYNYTNNSWNNLETQLTAISSYVYNSSFYGSNGIEQGTMFTNTSNKIDDLDAKLVSLQLQKYAELPVQTINVGRDFRNIYNNSAMLFIPTDYNGNAKLDTSNVTNMSQMFYLFRNLINIPYVYTNNVINLQGVFMGCYNLRGISDFWNTSNVVDIDGIFSSCSNLTQLPKWNLYNVTNISGICCDCHNLVNANTINLPNIINFNVNCLAAFQNCYNLINFPNLNFENNYVVAYGMFNNCRLLKNLNFMNYENTVFTNPRYMFSNCGNLINVGDLKFNGGDSGELFNNCGNLITAGNITVTNSDAYSMFNNCRNLESIGNIIINYRTSTISAMFNNCTKLTDINFSVLNFSSLTQTQSTFANCYNLVNLNSEFNFSKLQDGQYTFANCYNLTEINILPQGSSSITRISSMFSGCNNLSNSCVINIIKWLVNSKAPSSSSYTNLMNTNCWSPFYNTKFNNSYYTDYISALQANGWIC